MLSDVVAQGTGARAIVEGYAVAGKTGTAQKLDPVTRAYSRRPGVLSFVGFVPAQAPRLAILALLDEPKTVAWGSEAAAPIFAAVARQALRHLEVPPQESVPQLQIVRASPGAPPVPAVAGPALEPEGAEALMPDLKGRSLRQALAMLASFEVEVAVSGRGIVVRQTPAPGVALGAGDVCHLELAPPAGAQRT